MDKYKKKKKKNSKKHNRKTHLRQFSCLTPVQKLPQNLKEVKEYKFQAYGH